MHRHIIYSYNCSLISDVCMPIFKFIYLTSVSVYLVFFLCWFLQVDFHFFSNLELFGLEK